MNTIRIILSLTTYFGSELLQFDMKNAFSHGHLKEEVYMESPLGSRSIEGIKCVG